MNAYQLSELARLDLFEIADYTFETWGEEQAYRYLDDLEDCFRRIARSPGIGRLCDHLHPGYRRLEHQKHVIFYRTDEQGIFISRILHERMVPRPRLFKSSEAE